MLCHSFHFNCKKKEKKSKVKLLDIRWQIRIDGKHLLFKMVSNGECTAIFPQVALMQQQQRPSKNHSPLAFVFVHNDSMTVSRDETILKLFSGYRIKPITKYFKVSYFTEQYFLYDYCIRWNNGLPFVSSNRHKHLHLTIN